MFKTEVKKNLSLDFHRNYLRIYVIILNNSLTFRKLGNLFKKYNLLNTHSTFATSSNISYVDQCLLCDFKDHWVCQGLTFLTF